MTKNIILVRTHVLVGVLDTAILEFIELIQKFEFLCDRDAVAFVAQLFAHFDDRARLMVPSSQQQEVSYTQNNIYYTVYIYIYIYIYYDL